jgi:xanthine dehydrogenase accessory factor
MDEDILSPAPAASFARIVASALGRRRSVLLCTVVQSALPETVPTGAKIVCPDGEAARALGLSADAARRLCGSLPLHAPPARPEVRTIEVAVGPAAGAVEIYCEHVMPPVQVAIIGAGHIARALAALGATLGWQVTVADDRPDFATPEFFPAGTRVACVPFVDVWKHVPVDARTAVVLVTRGHRHDESCLSSLAGQRPFYIGMIGSRRRVHTAMSELSRSGVDLDFLARVYAPIGLPLAGRAPAEIALAVAAEIVAVQHGRWAWVRSQKDEYYKSK